MSNDRLWLYCERCGALHWVGKWWPRGLAGEAIADGEDAMAFMGEHLTWCRDRAYYGGGRQGRSGDLGDDRLWVRPISESERGRLRTEAALIGQPDNADRTAPEFVVAEAVFSASGAMAIPEQKTPGWWVKVRGATTA